ncbi:MAG: DUF6048 family protein [Roseivirga sp.]
MLALWLGGHSPLWAAVPARKAKSAKQLQRTSQAPKGQKPAATAEKKEAPPAPPLKKPKPLAPAQVTHEDPLLSLDPLIVKRPVVLVPYVPLIQTIDIALDYGNLVRGLWPPMTHRYEGSLSILWRKNVQLSGSGGYNSLVPSPTKDKSGEYTTTGFYYCLGLDYFVRYNLRNNLYAGLRYCRSHFTHHVQPNNPAEDSISEDFKASWWEMVIGSEHQLFSSCNFYAGFVIRLKGLGQFEAFAPAANYVVPGYGLNAQSIVPDLKLYIKYKISFLEKQIRFD